MHFQMMNRLDSGSFTRAGDHAAGNPPITSRKAKGGGVYKENRFPPIPPRSLDLEAILRVRTIPHLQIGK